jgi:hypothetical protein
MIPIVIQNRVPEMPVFVCGGEISTKVGTLFLLWGSGLIVWTGT